MRRKKTGIKFISAGVIVVLCTVLVLQSVRIQAALERTDSNEVRSVHIKSDDVEDSTLIIGSHLIHISALTDALYDIAMESANTFSQYDMYYKSELSGGQWYEISSAVSIEDITTLGTPVDKSKIEELEFTHHTKSDGVTYDLTKDAAVSVFDINKPYNMREMEELQPLIDAEKELLKKRDMETQTKSDEAYIEMIDEFFQIDLRNENTNKLDDTLRALQDYKNVLTGNQAEAAMIDQVDKVMEQVDAARRVEAYTILEEELNILLIHATGTETEEEAEEREKKKEIAEAAVDSAKGMKDRKDYDQAIETLKKAYEETELPQLQEEIKEARIEKGIWQADTALEKFEKKVKDWRNERNDLEGKYLDVEQEKAEIDEDIKAVEAIITDIKADIEEEEGKGEEEKDEEKIEQLNGKLAGQEKELEAHKKALSKINDDMNRLEELNKNLEEERLKEIQKEELAGTLDELQKLYEELKDSRLFNKIRDLGRSVPEEKEEEEEDYSFDPSASVVDAVAKCIENVQTKSSDFQGKCLVEGTSISSKAAFEYTKLLTDSALAGDHSTCDTAVDHLNDLQNIMDGQVVKRERELALLDSDLVSRAYAAYRGMLAAGVSEEYQKAVADKSSRAVLNRLLEQQRTETDGGRLEYQNLLTAKTKRMENQDAQTYMLGLIDGVPQLEAAVNQDASAASQQITVADHLAWLKEDYARIVGEGSKTGELDELNQKKDMLQNQMRDALDGNDLAEADRQKALLEANQQDIDDKQAELAAIMNSSSSSEADKAAAAAELGAASSAANLNQIASNAAGQIRDGNTGSLAGAMAAIEAVGALEPEAAQAALAEVKGAAEDMLALDSGDADDNANENAKALQDLVDQADAMSRSLSEQGRENGMSRDELLAFLENLLGGSFSELSQEGKAGMVLAMEWYGEHTLNGQIAEMAAMYARQMEQEANPYVYAKYGKELKEYVSVKALGAVLTFRYIFDDTEQTVTLQKAKAYYQFAAGQKKYQMTEEKNGMLKAACGLQNTLYIVEDDAKTLFSCEAEYIDRAVLGIVVTPALKASAEEIYEALLEAS